MQLTLVSKVKYLRKGTKVPRYGVRTLLYSVMDPVISNTKGRNRPIKGLSLNPLPNSPRPPPRSSGLRAQAPTIYAIGLDLQLVYLKETSQVFCIHIYTNCLDLSQCCPLSTSAICGARRMTLKRRSFESTLPITMTPYLITLPQL